MKFKIQLNVHIDCSDSSKLFVLIHRPAVGDGPAMERQREIERDIYIYMYIYCTSVCTYIDITYNHL